MSELYVHVEVLGINSAVHGTAGWDFAELPRVGDLLTLDGATFIVNMREWVVERDEYPEPGYGRRLSTVRIWVDESEPPRRP